MSIFNDLRLSVEDVEFLMGDKYADIPSLWDKVFGPRYQMVRYRGAIDRIDYERPDTFYALGPESPSDCVWMVPIKP